MAAKYLRQTGTNHTYVYTEALAKRTDMAPCDNIDPDDDSEALAGDSQPKLLEEMTKAQLLALSGDSGVEVSTAMKKEDIIARLREAQGQAQTTAQEQ